MSNTIPFPSAAIPFPKDPAPANSDSAAHPLPSSSTSQSHPFSPDSAAIHVLPASDSASPFSARFMLSSRFGREGIPRPTEFYRRLMGFNGDSIFDLDPAMDTTPLSGTAGEIPGLLESVIIDVTSSIHHDELVPHTVADALEWILADIAVLGIFAEATFRTQKEPNLLHPKAFYLQQVAEIASALQLDDLADVEMTGLHTALSVGTRVLNEIFQEEISSSWGKDTKGRKEDPQ